ncbi:AP-1 complex subunit sigma-2 [Papilio machaon]|uniref:AP-1 complex subunit sigma-2 n=1 Tax=Papilio machaon TaxID=76193 RepID=A0A0N1PJ42_PAPMA|nr:AP-1 complex subunit sigma-2 [Papilio machaon]
MDPSLEAVRGTAFVLNPNSGVLTLNMQPTASMHGMFQFQVLATDTEEATDTANVKIYLISSMNRVFFIFVNTLEQIEKNKDFIAQTFSIGFNMTCNVDQVVPATDSSGVALDDLTEVRAHFIRDNTPVTTDVIEELRSDTALLRTVQTTLNTELLVLRDLVTGDSPTLTPAAGRNAVYVLAALCALLTLICLVLLITFFVKSRALKRRLEALSMTKYGSQDSGLNRAGLAAPGTNKHATEGSNPIWNEAIKAPDFDAISGDSDDSDLIGIENLPQFRDDYFPPENSSIRDVDVVNDNNKMQFMLLFSRQGKLRLQKWYVAHPDKLKKKITRELITTVLARKPKMCSFLEWKDVKVVYKRYASLYFCCAMEQEDNELLTLELIHRYVELLDKYFGSVCELDIIFNFEKAYFILDELVLGGELQETSKKNVLKAIAAQDLLQEDETVDAALRDVGLL